MRDHSFAWITSLIIATAVSGAEQTVHIRNGSAQGSAVLCGGTKNGSHRVLLSVAHVTGTTRGHQVIATIAGRQYRAVVVGADSRSDASALVVSGRGLENIKPARLWLGEIKTDAETRTEGFHGNQFVRTVGRPSHVINGAQIQWTAASFPGMSGGPTYLSGHDPPVFLSTTTASDFRSLSLGPYRTWFAKWIPTLKTPHYQLTCNSSGMIQMRPRGSIEGPIAVPTAPPETPPQETAQPEPTPAQAEISTKELMDLIKLEIAKKPAPRIRVQPQDEVEIDPAPPQQVPELDVSSHTEVITINVPVTLRITDSMKVEVVE